MRRRRRGRRPEAVAVGVGEKGDIRPALAKARAGCPAGVGEQTAYELGVDGRVGAEAAGHPAPAHDLRVVHVRQCATRRPCLL